MGASCWRDRRGSGRRWTPATVPPACWPPNGPRPATPAWSTRPGSAAPRSPWSPSRCWPPWPPPAPPRAWSRCWRACSARWRTCRRRPAWSVCWPRSATPATSAPCSARPTPSGPTRSSPPAGRPTRRAPRRPGPPLAACSTCPCWPGSPGRSCRPPCAGGACAWSAPTRHGLPAEAQRDLDLVVRVPLAARAESLNLAAAAAVLLYETARRQAPTEGFGEPRGGAPMGREAAVGR
jgi:hypothetical protein